MILYVIATVTGILSQVILFKIVKSCRDLTAWLAYGACVALTAAGFAAGFVQQHQNLSFKGSIISAVMFGGFIVAGVLMFAIMLNAIFGRSAVPACREGQAENVPSR